MALAVVILAAGKGTRMKSSLPKVLHPIAGKPMLAHAIDAAKKLSAQKIIVVYGHGGDTVRETINDDAVIWVEQKDQLGTGHAVQQTITAVTGCDTVLVLYGDVPLIKTTTLNELLVATENTAIGVITQILDDPQGYGRIVRNESGAVQAIVEQKDANAEQLKIAEINTGIMCFSVTQLSDWLSRMQNNNAQGEYYLTDLIGFAVADGVSVATSSTQDKKEVQGVNDRVQLAELERYFQGTQAERLMREGVTLSDPERIDIRGEVNIGSDSSVDINCIFEGKVSIGSNVQIGANCIISNSEIKDNVTILANTIVDNATVDSGSKVGPFARLRPGAKLNQETHIGNFVEIKNAEIGIASKVNHLSYIGDANIGANVNIGAGTITCNYDGAYKHRTIIGDDAFIGSCTQLVAPVTVGIGATIGAGSTITKDTPDQQLTLSRAKQITLSNWVRPVKNKE